MIHGMNKEKVCLEFRKFYVFVCLTLKTFVFNFFTDSRHNLSVWNNKELQIGSRCSITFTEKNQKIKRHGYVQQMSPNKGPVVVFVEELGEK